MITEKQANRCTTHSHACDCREYSFALADQERLRLRSALRDAEAALADIGDADREPGDDLAWCERRAAKALPSVRVALAT